MLERIAKTVGSVTTPQHTVIVAAAEQELPSVDATIVRDSAEHQGPLAAITTGLERLASQADAVFVTGCDTPLLSASVISLLFDRLADFDCVVPRDAERLYPLCAVYSCSILPKLRAFEGRSLHGFISTLNGCTIPCDVLRTVDPELNSLRNINSRGDYVAALAAAGLSTP
jgi:molybdopterin-guanine dinucleotide biosynthesis protein A